jgi:hypothetical protein
MKKCLYSTFDPLIFPFFPPVTDVFVSNPLIFPNHAKLTLDLIIIILRWPDWHELKGLQLLKRRARACAVAAVPPPLRRLLLNGGVPQATALRIQYESTLSWCHWGHAAEWQSSPKRLGV